jgi:hypothetical protein
VAADRPRNPSIAAGFLLSVSLTLVELLTEPPWWLIGVLWLGLVASVGWFLWAVWPSVREWRNRRRPPMTGSSTLVINPGRITASGSVVTLRVETPAWTAGASAQPWFHEMFPHLRGVLLWVRPKNEAPMESGTYFCVVEGPNQRHPQAKSVVEDFSGGSLQLIYPKDFSDAPALPLDAGDYAVDRCSGV